MTTSPDYLFAYGSLMSMKGRERSPDVNWGTDEPRVAHLPGIRRSFGKLSGVTSGHPRLTMNLSAKPQSVRLGKGKGVEGLLLSLPPGQLDKVRSREGWPPKLWEALKRRSGADLNTGGFAGVLQKILGEPPNHLPDIVGEWVRCLSNNLPASPPGNIGGELIPVPVEIEDIQGRGEGVALVSWAPFASQMLGLPPSGQERIGALLKRHEVAKLKIDKDAQLEYYRECALGAEQGIDVSDFLDPGWEQGQGIARG